MGVGAVQANVAVFGADQRQKTAISSSYFEQYYAAVNVGGIIATIYVPLVINDDSKNLNKNYFDAFFVAACTLLFSALSLAMGYSYYIHITTNEAVVMNWCPVLFNSCSSRCARSPHQETHDSHVNSFMDYAHVSNGGRFRGPAINAIKSFHRAIIVFLLLIPYWLVYAQVSATWLEQSY